MPVYLALFRGINVSGHNIIKMEHLRNLMIANGYINVETYIQSGNVVFETDETDKAKIAHGMQLLLYKEYGYDVTIFILNEADLINAIDNNPYTDKVPEPSGKKKYHVVFLSNEATNEGLDKMKKYNRSDDVFTAVGKVMYLKLAQSAAESKLTNPFIEGKLNNCKATTRNWNTTLKMLEMIQNRSI
ncbi:DUF1697 domain-containing protein [Flavobacterium salilacus subsp. salilacus]|uniref:DUF1697 domain-containing protein n=1 Tax=Flavobacterium TaxID=237 RepID=UPI0010756D92|nr:MULTISPECIES: DUF1697 domain-containing protein [Flavobacterium]KAF2516294.1 DUF1697 domain-containing protein [Flavobacterium salilacus subsp. salilacus]MBE1613824.1 DUF1697 domain-containing protein [Flavobacterium sp. SaA2.13]